MGCLFNVVMKFCVFRKELFTAVMKGENMLHGDGT